MSSCFLLFTNFNINVDNRGLPEEIGETRANCGQRCMMFSNCHFCETAMKFSNALRKRHFEEKKIIRAAYAFEQTREYAHSPLA